MIERLKIAYADDNRVKLAAFAGLLTCTIIFTLLSGGFPPSAWRFLFFSVLPNLSSLHARQGSAVYLPLFGLILLSLSLFIVWAVLVTLMLRTAISLWQSYHARQHFNMDLREAEELAERTLAARELEDWFADGEPRTQQAPMGVAGATGSLYSAATDVMPANKAAQRREYATTTRAARVAGGGQIFPETPTPVASPTFMGPVSPAPMARRSVPLTQQGMWDARGQQSRPAEQYAQNAQTMPARSKTGSLLSPNPATNAVRKQLRVVPPPTIEEAATKDSERSLDEAFSALLERERGKQASQPGLPESADIARYPTRPAWGEIEDVPDTADADPFTQSMHSVRRRPSQPIAQPISLSSLVDVGPATSSLKPAANAQTNNVYDTIPIDEDRLAAERELAAERAAKAGVAGQDDEPRLVVGIGLDPGIKRRNSPNEDSIFAIQGMRITDNGSHPAGLFVVADGMGGHANGREASRTAIHTVSDVIVPALLRNAPARNSNEEETIFKDMLKDGVHRANLAIYKHNRESQEMMGTTLTAALIANSTAYIGNVGDSRTYLYRQGEGLRQVTRDHSAVAKLVESGAIAPEDIYTHPQRNIINRCLGEHASVELDMFVQPLQPGDTLLLCSDGLWEMVRGPALERLVAASAHNPTQLSAILVQAALNHGGVDNISVIVVGFLQGEE